MEVATVSSSFALHRRMLARTASSTSLRTCKASISSARVSPSTGFVPSSAGGSVFTEFSGVRIRPESISGASVSGFRGKRGVVTMVKFYAKHIGKTPEQIEADIHDLIILVLVKQGSMVS